MTPPRRTRLADRATIDMELACWLKGQDVVTVDAARRHLRGVFLFPLRPIDNRFVAELLEGHGYAADAPGARLVLSGAVYRSVDGRRGVAHD